MSSSLVSTVLDIEREAEAVLSKAENEARKVVEDAKAKRVADGKAYFEDVAREVAQLEEKADAERKKKVGELAAAGEAALSAVRNVSESAFDSGVECIMKALTEK